MRWLKRLVMFVKTKSRGCIVPEELLRAAALELLFIVLGDVALKILVSAGQELQSIQAIGIIAESVSV
jgi:hypothetical protein